MKDIAYFSSIVLYLIALYLFEKKIYNLKKQHREELRTVKESLPIVQHCNSRTKYEFIKHRWDPWTCIHCKEVEDLLNER